MNLRASPDIVAGVDEVGRGCLSGPVVAAAVILPPGHGIVGLADSKAVPAARRRTLAAEIRARCLWAIGEASVAEITRLNIRGATFAAMARAVSGLPHVPARVIVDGDAVPPGLPCPGIAVIGGDATEAAISAASILAKVHRDDLMGRLAEAHPGYGWEANAGYGTASHLAAIRSLGPTPHHRPGFRGVREWIVAPAPLPPAQGSLDFG